MAGLITFMNSTVGRVVRVILGLALIWLGLMGPLLDAVHRWRREVVKQILVVATAPKAWISVNWR